jgi:hypothetical protein
MRLTREYWLFFCFHSKVSTEYAARDKFCPDA